MAPPMPTSAASPTKSNPSPAPPTMTEVRDLAMKLYGRYAGRPVFELLKADWKKFGLDVVKGDTLAQKLIVPIEG